MSDSRDDAFKEASNNNNDDKDYIEVRAGILHELTDQLEQIISEHPESGVYQRGGYLVEVSVIPRKMTQDGVERKKGTYTIAPVSSTRLRELGSRFNFWKRFDARHKKMVRCDCPREVADTLAGRNSWDIPVLVALLGAPTVDNKGEVVSDSGYNSNTGVYLHCDSWKKIPRRKPTQSDAIKARERLEDLVSEFPFVDDAARSAWVAALLTSLIRWSLPTAPFFAFDAPVMGSGKTLLSSLIGILSNGVQPAVMNHPKDESELKKSLLAALMSGDPILLIDNIEHSISGDVLCSIATSDTYRDRMLGQNKLVTVSTAVTVLLNGNNMVVRGDLSTRVLISRLDPGVEKPEERTFKRADIKQYATEHREELVNCALTILRAYYMAKNPELDLAPYGRFEEWSERVRAPLVWAGGVDPCKTRARVETSDPERENLAALLDALWGVYQDDEILIRTIISDIHTTKSDEIDQLRDIVNTIAGNNGKINQRRLGNRISGWEGRVANGKRLIRGEKFRGAVKWQVVSTDSTHNSNSDSYDSYDSSKHPNAENCQKKPTVSGNGAKQTNTNYQTITPIEKACQGLKISPDEFKQKLSTDDLADIANGMLDSESLRQWAIQFNNEIYGGDNSE